MLTDLFCLFSFWAFYTLGYWTVADVGYEPVQYLDMWPIGVFFVGLNAAFRLYNGNFLHPSIPLPPVEELRRLACSSILVHVLVMAILGFSRTETEWSRLVLVCSCCSLTVCAQPFRDVVRRLLWRWGIGQVRMVMLGSGSVARQLAEALSGNPYYGVRLVGYFDDGDAACGELARLGGLRDVVEVSRRLKVRRIVTCVDQRILRCRLRELTSYFIQVGYFPEQTAFPVLGARPLSVEGIGGLEMVNQAQMRFVRFQKCLLDWFLSIAVFVLALPLFAIISALVGLTSRGPVFYRQRRLGRQGRPFLIWKFRTMYADAERRLQTLLKERPDLAAEWEAKRKLQDDPRITPFGRFLRRTSLDELPQLLNVFAGDMSLIGPRPIVEEEVSRYGERYDVLSRVKPGVTGLWQSQGRSDTDYVRRVFLDVYYVMNWSIWLDLWILCRTLGTVVQMKGAR